ncbi:LexA family protein [Pseudomonas protegens]|uniref:LexA family protein n=1 Tax=Pseudomonas protegens TaxID=380021 RepID=UPI00069D7366|nr:S24 family peptidase [Pseudomonas protegens]
MKISNTRLQNFRRVLAERKLRLTDIADLLGKAPAQVSAFGGKNPTKGIGDQIAREIEKALNLYNGYLDVPYGFDEFNNATTLSHTGRKIPIISATAASSWYTADNDFKLKDTDDWINAPGPVGPRTFALRVEGISMEPKFMEGDKVVIDPSLEISPGDYVAAQHIRDNFIAIKQLKQEGQDQYLFALNPDWPERIIKVTQDWNICGRACWKISKL